MNDSKMRLYGVLNAAAFVVMVVVNALSAQLPINGITPGEVSDSFPNLFAPAGITFSIWGVIYLLLTGFILYQFGVFKGKSGYSLESVKTIGLLFVISSAANAAWIFSWHYFIIPLSLVLMLVILICLIMIHQRLMGQQLSTKEKIFVKLPFSIYFGWITIATIANVTTLLVSLGWDGFGISEAVWMVIVLAVGVVIAGTIIIGKKDIFYGLVILWAYAGILIKHLTVFAGQYVQVITASGIALGALLVCVIIAAIQLKTKIA